VLTKEQALAVMDAHIIRVEAERRRRLERRAGRLRVLFPILRQVPIEEVMALVDYARRQILRQWTFYFVAVTLIAVPCGFLLPTAWSGSDPPRWAQHFPWSLCVMGAMGLVIYLHVRANLRRDVPVWLRENND
jgi:hypothetical protein